MHSINRGRDIKFKVGGGGAASTWNMLHQRAWCIFIAKEGGGRQPTHPTSNSYTTSTQRFCFAAKKECTDIQSSQVKFGRQEVAWQVWIRFYKLTPSKSYMASFPYWRRGCTDICTGKPSDRRWYVCMKGLSQVLHTYYVLHPIVTTTEILLYTAEESVLIYVRTGHWGMSNDLLWTGGGGITG